MEKLIDFINAIRFPCLMAKAVAKNGNLKYFNINEHSKNEEVLSQIYEFVNSYRSQPKKLSSCIIQLDHENLKDFSSAENFFWSFINDLAKKDRRDYGHDPRVSSNIWDNLYSYSLMEEAFFILLLHPKSPRLARRFSSPAIVFNPHNQFEILRRNKKFYRIRDLIRKRDEQLQGYSNPMLSDYGAGCEVFQYTGRNYQSGEDPRIFLQGDFYADFGTTNRDSA